MIAKLEAYRLKLQINLMHWPELSLILIKKEINLLCNFFLRTTKLPYPNLDVLFRRSNNLMNKLQERRLRVVYNDYDSSFNKLPEMAIENTIHIKNIHILMTEIYKFLNYLSPPIMNEICKIGFPLLLRKPKIIDNQL